MTDDDGDIEITELSYESESGQNDTSYICTNFNNNDVRSDKLILNKVQLPNEQYSSDTLDRTLDKDIPDLLKNVSKDNNNVEILSFDLNYSAADIENNFNTKNIIGDFNKEIEEEIKQLLNYNINIEDDLEELRKDIKDTFAKPIENTINNISEVVNHVIKKLVQNHSDTFDHDDDYELNEPFLKQKLSNEVIEINRENERKSRTDMSLSRPTFLLIENNTNGKITDAFLSDGKDEINMSEYDTEKLSQNVENTIKQLSTELRKIIPKLDEMKERDRFWAECNKAAASAMKDGNSNDIGNSSKHLNYSHIRSSMDDNLTAEKSRNNGHQFNYTRNLKSPMCVFILHTILF